LKAGQAAEMEILVIRRCGNSQATVCTGGERMKRFPVGALLGALAISAAGCVFVFHQ